jgi:hypothetical protein
MFLFEIVLFVIQLSKRVKILLYVRHHVKDELGMGEPAP